MFLDIIKCTQRTKIGICISLSIGEFLFRLFLNLNLNQHRAQSWLLFQHANTSNTLISVTYYVTNCSEISLSARGYKGILYFKNLEGYQLKRKPVIFKKLAFGSNNQSGKFYNNKKCEIVNT